MLNGGLEIKALFHKDPLTTSTEHEEKEFRIRIQNALKLKEDYPELIEIRITPISHVTSRRVVFDKLAIDARKLLSEDETESTYVGTFYMQNDFITYIKGNFDSAWKRGIPIAEGGLKGEKELFMKALPKLEETLGKDHTLTETVRGNLDVLEALEHLMDPNNDI